MFLLKKIVALFLMPLTLSLLFLVSGWAFAAGTLRRRLGLRLMVAGMVLLGLSGWRPVAESLVCPLENRFPPLLDLTPYKEVKWVVVLGGGQQEVPDRSNLSRLSASSLARLAEGIRIHRRLPQSRLLLSGGSGFSGTPDAQAMAEAARELGVNPSRVVLEDRSRDTEDQAREVGQRLNREPMILVTSALHLPRSMDLFHEYGQRPIPAPCGYLGGRRDAGPEYWIPGGASLFLTEAALHEYLGMAWNAIRRTVLARQ